MKSENPYQPPNSNVDKQKNAKYLQCPYCNNRAMSAMGKFMLGPARSVKCQSCAKRVSVSWASMISIVVGMAAYIVMKPFMEPKYILLALVPVVVLVFIIHYYFIKIVGREKASSK